MSLYPIIKGPSKNTQNSTTGYPLFPARVKQVLLSDNNKMFTKLGGWASIGSIQFIPLQSYTDINKENNFYAKPLFSNIKQYPLKEETVLIISGPVPNNPNTNEYYYIPIPIGVWNSPNHNALPDVDFFNSRNEDITLGKTFKESNEARNLKPEEGDVIIQGRNNHGIRFSSTSKNTGNPWSSVGDEGSPIIILSNNFNKKNDDPWVPTYEDINEDGSSIYMCSTQEIPINFSSKNLQTLNITLSNGFNPSLQIEDNNSF